MSDSALPSEIQGERGTLLIDHIADPRLLRLQPFKGTAVEREIPKPPGNLEYSLERFVALVNGDRDATADHERTLNTLRLTDELRNPTGRSMAASCLGWRCGRLVSAITPRSLSQRVVGRSAR